MNNPIAKLNNGILTISPLPDIDQRKKTRITIQLNMQKNIDWDFLENTISVNFKIVDETIIGEIINKILSIISNSLSVFIDKDLSVQNLTNLAVQNNKGFSERLSTLILLKKTKDIQTEQQFINYKAFCDSTLSCKLRPYQYTASFYLTIGNGGFDFSVPGSGKTIISYAAYNWFKNNNICNSILIIGPINSYNAWHDEYSTCFGAEPDIENLNERPVGYARLYLTASEFNHSEITFINIDKVPRLTNELMSYLKNKKTLLIIDEAHKEKNPEAKITIAVKEITKFAKARVVLTGTPMPNGYEDLDSVVSIFSPYNKILPYRYNELKAMTKNGANSLQIKTIMNSLKPWYSRVSKKYLIESGELLMPNFQYVHCEMSSEQKEIYDFLEEIYFNIDNDFDSKYNLNLAKAILIRQMQVSSNPALLKKSIIDTIDEYRDDYIRDFEIENSDIEGLQNADKKIMDQLAQSNLIKIIKKFDNNQSINVKNNTAVKMALDLVSQGKKVILWEIFVKNMYSLCELIKKSGYGGDIEIINGLVVGQDRNQAINNFKYGKSMILIANPATLAESLSLHKTCQDAIYVNRNFNAAQFIQSKDRIHRIDMPFNTTANYYMLINSDSIDEKVHERLLMKETNMLRILDSDDIEISGNDFQDSSFISNSDIESIFKNRGF